MKSLKNSIIFLILSIILFSCSQESRSQDQTQDSLKTDIVPVIEVDTSFEKYYTKDMYNRMKNSGGLQIMIYNKKLNAKFFNKKIKFNGGSEQRIMRGVNEIPLKVYIFEGFDINEEMQNINPKLYVSYLHRFMPDSTELRYETNFGEIKSNKCNLGGTYIVIHEKRIEKSSSQVEYILAATLFTFEGNAIKYLPIKNEITDKNTEGFSVSRIISSYEENPNIELSYEEKTKILTYTDENGKQEKYKWKEEKFIVME